MAEILAQQVEATHINTAAEAVTVVEVFTVVEGVEGNLKGREVNLKTLTIEFQPNRELSKNGLGRSNWRATSAHKDAARGDAYVLGRLEMEDGWVTPKQCNVEVTQYWCGKPFDWDGLATLTGPVIDGLVDAGAMPEDDSPEHILQYSMYAKRVPHRSDSRVAVKIIPVNVNTTVWDDSRNE